MSPVNPHWASPTETYAAREVRMLSEVLGVPKWIAGGLIIGSLAVLVGLVSQRLVILGIENLERRGSR